MIRPVSKALTPADELKDVGRQLVQHDSSHMPSLWARPAADATAVPAMCGAPRVRRAIGSVDVKCVVFDRKSEDKQPAADSARISKLYSPLHRPHGHVVSDHSDGRARRRQDGLSW